MDAIGDESGGHDPATVSESDFRAVMRMSSRRFAELNDYVLVGGGIGGMNHPDSVKFIERMTALRAFDRAHSGFAELRAFIRSPLGRLYWTAAVGVLALALWLNFDKALSAFGALLNALFVVR